MKILVTGGAGFIGTNLCRHLSQYSDNFDLVVLDDFSSGQAVNLKGVRAQIIEGTILSNEDLAKAASGCQAIVHLAARPSVPRSLVHPDRTHEVNATGTMNVLECARKTNAHVVVASSSSVYGASLDLPKSEDLLPRPMSPYGASKLAAESYALAWHTSFDLPVLALRFFNVFGPWQRADHDYAAVIPMILASAISDRPVPIYGDGEQTRDFTYVATVCQVIEQALRRRVTSPTPVNLAFGSRRSVAELVAIVQKVTGHSIATRSLPPRQSDIKHSSADPRRLLSLFPDIQPLEFETGIRETYEWLRSDTVV